MSTAAVSEFLEKVGGDQALQADLVKAMQAPNDREAVTQLANDKGFEFTSEELWAEVQQRQQEFESRQTAGELSDEELEAVAGGATPTFIFVTIGISVGSAASVTVAAGTQTTW